MSRQLPSKRIALFGGSFDPVHLGHLFIAERAHQALELDEVIFLPAHRSPFKREGSSVAARHRLEMIRLAIEKHSWASVSDYETSLGDTSYSWRSAEHFQKNLQESGEARLALFWILGADQWHSLQSWNRPDYLAELVEFIVFGRNAITPSENPSFRGHFIEGTFPAASTRIRSSLAGGNATNLPLDPRVLDYIFEHQLYSSRRSPDSDRPA